MSVDNFIPTVWAGTLLRALQTALVYGSAQVVNRDYEGDIAGYGDTVKINMIGDITISTYSKNTDINTAEALTDGQSVLRIDQAKYFNFQVDNVDTAQINPQVMSEAMNRASYQLRKTQDTFIAGLNTDIPSANTTGSSASPITGTWTSTGTQAYDRLVDLGVQLDTTDTPGEGRFAVVPPWADGYLRKDLRFVGYGTGPMDARLVSGGLDGNVGPSTGYIGEAAGFSVFKSNQVPVSSSKYTWICGHPMAWSFAQQLTRMVAYTPERRFGDAVKGLVVYGGKVVRPDNLAALVGQST